MYRIPLHALKIGGTPIIERNLVVYIQSISLLRFSLQLSEKADAQKQNALRAVIFNTLGDDNKATQSVQRLGNVLGDSAVTMSQCKKDKFAQLGAQADIIHAHGHLIFDEKDVSAVQGMPQPSFMHQPPRYYRTLHRTLMRTSPSTNKARVLYEVWDPSPFLSRALQIRLPKDHHKLQQGVISLQTLSIMQLCSLQFIAALALYIVSSHGSPIAFPEHKLEEINALRAEGVSEAAIAARFPRPLIIPAVAPLETPQLYPVVHSTEVLDAATVDIPAQFRHAHSRKRRLTQSVGKRGQEMGPRF